MNRDDDTDTARSVKGETGGVAVAELDLTPLWGRWLTREQLILGLGISNNTVAKLHQDGVRPHRVGNRNLYDVGEVHDWISRQGA